MSVAEGSRDDCAFCLIADQRAPAREIWRTEDVVAFLPDVPAVLGHVLVIPRAHVQDIWALDGPTGHLLADATRRVARVVASATGDPGLNVIQSNGAAAGQSVFHLHVHVVPRSSGDRMPDLWPADAAWSPRDLDASAASLRLLL